MSGARQHAIFQTELVKYQVVKTELQNLAHWNEQLLHNFFRKTQLAHLWVWRHTTFTSRKAYTIQLWCARSKSLTIVQFMCFFKHTKVSTEQLFGFCQHGSLTFARPQKCLVRIWQIQCFLLVFGLAEVSSPNHHHNPSQHESSCWGIGIDLGGVFFRNRRFLDIRQNFWGVAQQ